MNSTVLLIIQLFLGGLFGFAFTRLNATMDRNAKRQEESLRQELAKQERIRQADQEKQAQVEAEAEKERRELMILILQSTVTNRALSKATAIAIQNGRCNGEVKTALEAAEEVDKKQAQHLQQIGVKQVL